MVQRVGLYLGGAEGVYRRSYGGGKIRWSPRASCATGATYHVRDGCDLGESPCGDPPAASVSRHLQVFPAPPIPG